MKYLIDGDIYCYRVGFACNEEPEQVAVETLDESLVELMKVLDCDPDDVEVFLTGQGNFRTDYAVTLEYKGNRKDTPKPVHLSALRDYMVQYWAATISEGQEADDAICIRATELDGDCVIVSTDKDFQQYPGKHYNFVKQEMTEVDEATALMNFYSQFLEGDRADNIEGVKGIGKVKARKILGECKSELEMFEKCAELLGSRERAIENGRLLYLRRYPDEIWEPPAGITDVVEEMLREIAAIGQLQEKAT